jgi:hypothetical protein
VAEGAAGRSRRIDLPPGALSRPIVFAICADTEGVAELAGVEAVAMLEPRGYTLAEPALVTLDLGPGCRPADTFELVQLDAETGMWRAKDSAGLRKVGEAICFDTTTITSYALIEKQGGDGASGQLLLLGMGLAGGAVALNEAGGDGSGACFIATAAFGTPLAAEVDAFRRFRDEWLLTHAPGTAIVDAYYRLSPSIADAVARHPALAALVRGLLRVALTPGSLPAAASVGAAACAAAVFRRRLHRRV